MGGEVVFYEFLIALFMGLGALALFIWSVLGGQTEEMEDVKYRILESEKEDEQRTAR
jgi:cbb3-type cytochrome oxidase maturation protein